MRVLSDQAAGFLAPRTADALTVAALAVAVLAGLVAVVVWVRLARLRRSYAVLLGGGPEASLGELVGRQQVATDALRSDVDALAVGHTHLAADLADAIRHVAVVRYDAFDDMGGRLSFTAAFLDDDADGVVVTSINARTEARTYAKGIKAGEGQVTLSPEETEAVSRAMRRPPQRVTGERGGPP